MRRTVLASAVSLAALLAAPASAALSDFRLPGDTQRPPDPERVGPVAPDVPESRGPAPTPTPTRQSTRPPASQPSAEQPAIVVPELPAAAPTTASPRSAARPAEPRQIPAGELPAIGAPAPQPSGTAGAGLPEASTLPSAFPGSAPSPAEPATEEGGSFWLWALAALAALAAFALAAWAWRRRRPVVGSAAVPQLERRRLAPMPPAAPTKAPADSTPPEPLQVTLDPLRLSLTLMNATLAYRLEVANRGAAPIVNLAIGADMICAHASMSREQQLSGPGAGAATVQRIERLEPGESRIIEGEFRVPFTQIVPIRQGNAALLLPLARFRLVAEGAAPVVRTFAVGQPGAKAALQPFRLDLGPRVYPTLTQRAFA
jgi:hypothetical protein